MKKHNTEEEFFKKIIKETDREKASPDLFGNVMTAIEAKKTSSFVYKPLISRTVWIALVVIISLSVFGLFLMTTDFSMNWNFGLMNYISVPKIDLSSTMLYAIGFISLFFLQIPFLHNYMRNQYR
jgi:predicted RND superfamily exporter protein